MPNASPFRAVSVVFLGALVVSACSNDAAFVRADVEAIARVEFAAKAEASLRDAWIGEGDAEHRYYYAAVIVRAREPFRMETRLFKGLEMKSGDPSRDFTIELSYRWRNSRWQSAEKALFAKSGGG